MFDNLLDKVRRYNGLWFIRKCLLVY